MNVLDRVPMWLRSRWPLRRWYWQADEIAAVHARATRLERAFDEDRDER